MGGVRGASFVGEGVARVGDGCRSVASAGRGAVGVWGGDGAEASGGAGPWEGVGLGEGSRRERAWGLPAGARPGEGGHGLGRGGERGRWRVRGKCLGLEPVSGGWGWVEGRYEAGGRGRVVGVVGRRGVGPWGRGIRAGRGREGGGQRLNPPPHQTTTQNTQTKKTTQTTTNHQPTNPHP